VTSYVFITVTYILSRTVSKIWQIIGQTMGVDMVVLLFNALIQGEQIWDCDLWHHQTRNVAVLCGVKSISVS